MTFQIRKLTSKDYNELYQLLKQANFPYLPKDEKIAFDELNKPDNHLYGAFKENKLITFLCFTERNNRLYFDIACDESFKKRWANKQVLNFIFSTPFEVYGYDEFYTESLNLTAQKAVQKVGFEHIKGNFYKMSKNTASIQKYLKNVS